LRGISKVWDLLTRESIWSRASNYADEPDVLIHSANTEAGVLLGELDEASVISSGAPRVLNFPDANISCRCCSYRSFVKDALLVDGSYSRCNCCLCVDLSCIDTFLGGDLLCRGPTFSCRLDTIISFLDVLNAVTNKQDTVIDCGRAAVSRCQESRLVVSDKVIASGDCNSHRTTLKSGERVRGCDTSGNASFYDNFGAVVLASTSCIGSSVGVSCF